MRTSTLARAPRALPIAAALTMLAALAGCTEADDPADAHAPDAAPPDLAATLDAAPTDARSGDSGIRLNDMYIPPDRGAPPPDRGIDAAVDLGPPPLPDLLLLEAKLAGDIWLDEREFPPDDCAVIEGCIEHPGKRLLLRFGVVTANIGDTDLVMGRPEGNPDLFVYSDCHEHHHFERYADYRLMSGEDIVSVGHKQAFCLMDTERYLEADPDVRDQPRYRCAFQGISRGWQDTYHSRLDCQWIDVTDLAPGSYDLAVRINPDRIIEEKSYANNDATTRVEVPRYDIDAPCGDVSREDFRRACGWQMREVGQCAQGEVVEIGCGGCGDFGPACAGDPMLRVCDGEMSQCLPSTALAQQTGGCDDSPCPHIEFVCPPSGVFTVWSAPEIDGTDYVCDFQIAVGPPRLEEECQDGEDGLDRTCGWHRAAEVDGDCAPGFAYAVGCNPDGQGDGAACGLGAACEGDPMMRVCPGDAPCLPIAALGQDDDSCETYCPAITFECPPSGHYSVWHGAYRSERDYVCEPTVVRVVD